MFILYSSESVETCKMLEPHFTHKFSFKMSCLTVSITFYFFFFFDFLSVSSVPIFAIEGQSRLFCVMGRILQDSTSSPTVPTTAFRDPVRAVSFTRTLSIGEPSTRKWHGVEQINCPWPQEGHLSFISECFKKGICVTGTIFPVTLYFNSPL